MYLGSYGYFCRLDSFVEYIHIHGLRHREKWIRALNHFPSKLPCAQEIYNALPAWVHANASYYQSSHPSKKSA